MPEKPVYVAELEASFGSPSQNGFGSAVFFERVTEADLEMAAREKYRYFVGKNWERFGENAWLKVWKEVYCRKSETRHDIIAELRGIQDQAAELSVPMILEGIEAPEKAREALSRTYDSPDTLQLSVFVIGDGEAMSGLLIAGRRIGGDTTILVFLYD